MSLFLLHGAIYVLIGTFAGLMSGFLGIGGGLIVVPGLVFVFQQTNIIPETIMMNVAAGSSLAIMIFTSQSAIRAHYRLGDILWSVFNKLWPGIIIGTISGAVIALWIPTYWLKTLFAVFLFSVAIKMLTSKEVSRPEHFPKAWINRLVSFIVGLKSGLLGIGGGLLVIPYLTYCGISLRKIAAVSSLCTLTVALTGTLVVIITGHKAMAAIPYATGFVYWPAVLLVAIPSSITAPLGARLNYKLPLRQLQYGFIAILIVTAIKMLF